ncbi:MAG: hypothetical protein ACK5LJ_08155 [Paracoccus sp. (in: a-proteobacteria)]
MDLSTISVDALKREIESRVRPKPLFKRDGVEYHTVESYQALINYFDEVGRPVNATALEYDRSGALKASSVEPQFKVINLGAYVSNRTKVEQIKDEKGKVTKTLYHVVTDTRTVNEAETGNVTLQFIPEVIAEVAPRTASGFRFTNSSVSREDFLRDYKDAFGVDDMMRILEALSKDTSLDPNESTLSLPK